MKILIALLFVLSSSVSFAYDGRITDKYGRTTGYINQKDDHIDVYNKYGKKEQRIEDGRITDRYGKTTGYIRNDNSK